MLAGVKDHCPIIKLLCSDIPRMRQRSVEIKRSKCKSYVVLRGAILEQ